MYVCFSRTYVYNHENDVILCDDFIPSPSPNLPGLLRNTIYIQQQYYYNYED
jgi:hypothetical protein